MLIEAKAPQTRIYGLCATCGTAVDRLEHSIVPTCRADGARYVYPDEADKGWCIFRCRKCSSVIDDSWAAARSKTPNG